MGNHEEVATIVGQNMGPLEVVITAQMVPHNGIPVMETTLSIPSEENIDNYCNQLSYKYGVTFDCSLSGVMDLFYIGKNGNYQQFYSHP